MPNHWHLVLRAPTMRDLSRFMHALTRQHAQFLRRWRGTVGRGAVYQGRYRASLVHHSSYFCNAVRYVERNPVRAGLCERAEDWLWSSVSRIGLIQGVKLARWPVEKPRQWLDFVNEPEPAALLEFIQLRTRRGEHLADPDADIEDLATVRPVPG
jgi:putative transposase